MRQLLQPALADLRSDDPESMGNFDDLLPSEEHGPQEGGVGFIGAGVVPWGDLRTMANVAIATPTMTAVEQFEVKDEELQTTP